MVALIVALFALIGVAVRVDGGGPKEADPVGLPPGAGVGLPADGQLAACAIGPNMAAALRDQPCSRWVLRSLAAPRASLARDETLYLTNGAGFVEARHAPDGSQRWATSLDGPTELRAATRASVYLSVADRDIVALDAATGDVHWHHVLDPELTPLPGTNETVRQVLPLGNSAYVLGGSTLVAVDSHDGSTRWRWSEQHVLSAGTTAAGPYVVVSDGLVGLDSLRGSERWRLPLVTITNRPHRAELAMLVAGDATSLVVALDVLSGAVVWSFDTSPGPPVTLELTADTVVVAGRGGRLWGLDRSDGRPRWTWAPPSRASVDLIGIAPGVVLARVSDSATLAVIDAASGALRWQREFEFLDDIATSGDEILVADGHQIVALDLRDGLERWRHRFDSPVAFVAGDPESAPVLVRIGDEVVALQPPRE